MAGKKKYDWIKLRRVFTTSNISLREMSRNHNVSYNYLTRKSSEEDWFEKRDTMQREAREAVTAALLEQTDERNSELSKIVCKDGDMHLKRSLQTGDKLYTLFQAAVTAMTQGNLKDMRTAIDSWVTLDNQMRKIHGIEDEMEKRLAEPSPENSTEFDPRRHSDRKGSMSRARVGISAVYRM